MLSPLTDCLSSDSLAKSLPCFLKTIQRIGKNGNHSYYLSHLFDSNKGLIPSSYLFILYVKLTRESAKFAYLQPSLDKRNMDINR